MKKKYLSALLGAVSFGLFAMPAVRASDRADLVTEVTSCEAIIEQMQSVRATAIPPSVLRQARGLLITNQFKAGFILGVKGGYGVLMVKKANGQWSIPVLVRAHDISIGLQAGAKSVETVYVLTDEATPRHMFKQHFDLGVDAKAVAGPHVAEAEAFQTPLVAGAVLVYGRSEGLFAGATVKAAQIARDDDANFRLYGTNYEMPELLYSDWVKPPAEVLPLMRFVQSIAP